MTEDTVVPRPHAPPATFRSGFRGTGGGFAPGSEATGLAPLACEGGGAFGLLAGK